MDGSNISESLKESKYRKGWREVIRRSVMASLRPPEVYQFLENIPLTTIVKQNVNFAYKMILEINIIIL